MIGYRGRIKMKRKGKVRISYPTKKPGIPRRELQRRAARRREKKPKNPPRAVAAHFEPGRVIVVNRTRKPKKSSKK